MSSTKRQKRNKLLNHYQEVIKDLKKELACKDKDYCIGCYSCGIRLVYKTLESHYKFIKSEKGDEK